MNHDDLHLNITAEQLDELQTLLHHERETSLCDSESDEIMAALRILAARTEPEPLTAPPA